MYNISLRHRVKIEKGKLLLIDKDLFNKYLINLEGKYMDLILKKPFDKRSLPQNDRHWVRMTVAASILEDRTAEELHYDFCSILLVDRTKTPPRYRTSSDLSKEEFIRFEEDIDEILANMDIVIPDIEKLEV